MIDTVSITIPQEKFQIYDHNKFSPSTFNLFEPPYIKVTGRSSFRAINNPTKKDLLKHGYMPRLTLFKALRRNGFIIFLKIEFSAPKLLYGNNFDEVENKDFNEICLKLKSLLLEMGVIIRDVNFIKNAEVSTIHYSKNIILDDYSTPSMYLEEIRKVNVNKMMDMNQTDFRNEGHSFKYRSNDFEVSFYDKLKDLQQAKKSEKRTIEKDNFPQLNLFAFCKPIQPFEVLRLEVRIGSRKKLQHILSKFYPSVNKLDFQSLFNVNVSRKVLLSTMDNIKNAYPEVSKAKAETFKEFLVDLKLNNPCLSYSQLLKYVGTKALLDELGVREFRDITDKLGSNSWYRLNKSMKGLKFSKKEDVFDILYSSINEFRRVEFNKYVNNI